MAAEFSSTSTSRATSGESYSGGRTPSSTTSCIHPVIDQGACLDCGATALGVPTPPTNLCAHFSVDRGVCLDCGLTISGTGELLQMDEEFSGSHHQSNQSATISYEKDLQRRDLPDQVKSWVLQKAARAPKNVHRMGKRTKILYAYVYLAYLQLGMKFDPEAIADILEMDKKDVPGALQLVSGISSTALPQESATAVSAPIVVISPSSCLDEVIVKIRNWLVERRIDPVGVKNQVEQLIEISLQHNPMLYEEKPKWMAIAFVKYYLDHYKLDYPRFHALYDITPASIKTSLQKVRDVLHQISQQQAATGTI